ncbi:ParB family protein [Leifsonia sp. P73]|uniref:ParB family protein n=1 Tax=Leifsonia sp. P73 TaxID=3423959 RepID=UPI003DA448E0
MTLQDLSPAIQAIPDVRAEPPLADERPTETPDRPTAVADTLTTARKTTVTFYLSETLRNRARAAYRSTSFEERDSSWSEMLNKALIAEVERREAEYNRGEMFTASEAPLTPGRPIGF